MDDLRSHARPDELLGSVSPKDYRAKEFLKDGTEIALRQIGADDLDLLREFFLSLSRETVYYRFFKHRDSISREWLERFSHIDHDWDVVLIALTEKDSHARFVGLCQIMTERSARRGEIGVVVTDAWQGRGIRALLLDRSILLARRVGLRSLWALIRKENEKALALAFKFGFIMNPESQNGSWELELDLTEMEE